MDTCKSIWFKEIWCVSDSIIIEILYFVIKSTFWYTGTVFKVQLTNITLEIFFMTESIDLYYDFRLVIYSLTVYALFWFWFQLLWFLAYHDNVNQTIFTSGAIKYYHILKYAVFSSSGTVLLLLTPKYFISFV